MSKSPNPGSQTQDVYEQLRRRLLNGDLRPGERLKISNLCELLDANLSAVREALARLTAEGLILSEPQRGFHVAPISADDLRHLTAARLKIEAICVERAIACGDVAWETGIVGALHQVLRTPRLDDTNSVTPQWAQAHNALH